MNRHEHVPRFSSKRSRYYEESYENGRWIDAEDGSDSNDNEELFSIDALERQKIAVLGGQNWTARRSSCARRSVIKRRGGDAERLGGRYESIDDERR